MSKNHLARLKKYQQKKFRQAEQLVLVEGWNLLEQLVSNGIHPVEIYTSEDIATVAETLEQRAESAWLQPSQSERSKGMCTLYPATEHDIKQLSETESPQSVIALVEIPALTLEDFRAVIYLDGIRDPGNMGTIFRIASGFGFDGIVLSPDCCEVFSPKVIRASLGSVFWIPTLISTGEWLQSTEAVFIGLDARGDSTLRQLRLSADEPVVLVIGSESAGISHSVQTRLDYRICIPIRSNMESFNASVAAGIAAYELAAQLFLLT